MTLQEARPAVNGVIERVLQLAGTDAALREELVGFARYVINLFGVPAAAETPAAAVIEAPEPQRKEAAERRPIEVERPAGQIIVGPKIQGFAGSSRPAAPVEIIPTEMTRPAVTDADLPMLEARLRLKAEGARWAGQRQRLMSQGVDTEIEVTPFDRDIIERARQMPDCFLWMCHPSGPSPSDLSLYDLVADCFDTTYSAVGLFRRLSGDSSAGDDELEQALWFIAEAQSALRTAIERIGARADKDQQRTYHFIKDQCLTRRIYIDRFMRLDDPADPDFITDLDARIQQFDTGYQNRRDRGKHYEAGLKRVRYHAKALTSGIGERLHDWERVVETIDALVGQGLPPSNSQLRDILLPIAEGVPEPDRLPTNVRLVLREIDRYLANRPATEGDAGEDHGAPTEDVRRVAALLRGRTVVLIGGVRRRHAQEAICRAFDLAELDWVETEEHESLSLFEPHVAKPTVAVVLLAIRWSSHSYGDVALFCEKYRKPLVRLPAGYNPNQIAAQILSQASGLLRND